MLLEEIDRIKLDFDQDISETDSEKKLELVRIKYLSRKGSVTKLFEQLKEIPREDKPAIGKKLNSLRQEITDSINSLKLK